MPRYKVGDKIAQIHLDWSEKIDWKEVEKLSDSDRGSTGFGDSGN
jgi:dUTPase